MSKLRNIRDKRLSRNKWSDNLTYLDANDATTEALNDKTESMLTKIFGLKSRKFSNRNPFKIILNALKELQKLNFYWIHESINEHNVLNAENNESLVGLASLSGFQSVRKISASGEIRLQILSSLVNEANATKLKIENNAQIRSKSNGLTYTIRLRNDSYTIDFSSGADFVLSAKQGELEKKIYVGDGQPSQNYRIDSSNKNIENASIEIKSLATNEVLIEKGHYRNLSENDSAYILRNDFDGAVSVFFGDDVVGYRPKLAEQLEISYFVSEGLLGNILAESEFEVISGFKINDEEFDITDFSKISATHDFITGYDGDDNEVIRKNVGAQSMTNVIATPAQVKSFLRQYSMFSVSEVWREAGTAMIHSLMCPNLSALTKTSSYFALQESEFSIAKEQIDALKLSIFNDKRNVLVSTIDFKTYDIARFAALIFIKLSDNSLISDNLKQEIISIASDVLVESWNEHVRQIYRADFVSAIFESVHELKSIEVVFIAEAESEKYIDEIGDIDTSVINSGTEQSISNPEYVVPKFSNIEYQQNLIAHPIKIFVEQNINDWKEI